MKLHLALVILTFDCPGFAMTLSCFSQHPRFADFDLSSGTLKMVSQTEDVFAERTNKSAGYYQDLDGHRWALFSRGECLFLSLDGVIHPVTVDMQAQLLCVREPVLERAENMHMRRIYGGGLNKITVSTAGTRLIDLEYTPLSRAYFAFDWTQTEDEDFDFCLWIHNIINSEQRRQIMIDSRRGR